SSEDYLTKMSHFSGGQYTVATEDIKDNAVTSEKIRDGAVTKEKMADGIIGTAEIIDGSITAAKLASNSVTAAKIAANAVGSSEIAANAVGPTEIANNAVTTLKIADGNVTPAKLSFSVPTRPMVPPIATDEIANGAVTPPKLSFTPAIRPLAPPVTTDEIANGAVTVEKLTLGIGRFVAREVPVPDFNDVGKTLNGTWQINGLDLSAILPAGAVAGLIGLEFVGGVINDYLTLRTRDGVSNYIEAVDVTTTRAVVVQGIIKIEPDRQLDYKGTPGGGFNGYVLGWWI
ncbi:MAG: hypothetical protein AAB019_11260, partial [Planctomycetota bacterium]